MSEVVSIFLVPQWPRRSLQRVRLWVVPFLLLLLISASSLPLKAQRNTWKLLQTFPTSIGCGFFTDEDHGLLGSGIRWAEVYPNDACAIYRTTDGGITWTISTVPAQINGAVTSIWMQDSLTGFASILPSVDYSTQFTFGGSSLWKTTDGGSTWFDPFHLDHALTSVYAQNGLILITKWDGSETSHYFPPDRLGGDYSYDGGVTWTSNFRRCNGIAFSDSLHGVVTEMNPDSLGNNFWVTADAGRTWQKTTNQYESWSVYVMPGQRIYLCANESQDFIPHQSINWSTDGGFTWSQRASFPAMHFTGTIEGQGKTLYFQTDTGTTYSYDDADSYRHGMYRSDDTGATWHFINGPSTSRDTRFVVAGCMGQVVYAFDAFGDVYKTDDGGDGTLTGKFALTSDTINWLPNPCGDTLAFIVSGVNCIPVTIDSIVLPSGSEFLRLPNDGTLPQTLGAGDSTRMLLVYSPTASGRIVTKATIYAHSGEDVITKVVTIITQNSQPSTLSLSRDTSRMNAGACASANDTILLSNLACPGMLLDSVTFSNGEVSLFNALPTNLADTTPYPLHFLFQPNRSGVDTVAATVHAHDGRRLYDTAISIFVQSAPKSEYFVLDTTQVTLGTKYCQPVVSNIGIHAPGCDSIIFDSLVSSNGSFALMHAPAGLAPSVGDSLSIQYAPDSAGVANDSIRIFAHGKWGACDTTILISGSNITLPQSVTLSQDAITLATGSCLSLSDTLVLGNQGCGMLFLDSVSIGDGSEIMVTYDPTQSPIQSGNSLPIHIAYNPLDGKTKVLTLRVLMHTPSRDIDTTITVTVSNTIASEPLALSSDSLWLFTKYCQTVRVPFTIGNLGCNVMSIDSLVVSGDSLNEFYLPKPPDSLQPGQIDSTFVTFTPDSTGSRVIMAKLYVHENGQAIDTVITIAAKNLTAPAPFIPALPSVAAGQSLNIPIMLMPTTDTFSIHSYTFHLSFNTDLLTPSDLEFANTCSAHMLTYSFTPEPGIGCSGMVQLIDTVTQNSQLTLPLVYIKTNVALTIDTTTAVLLNTFSTDREPTLGLCSIPEQPFTIAMECGDPYLLDLLREQPISFSFIGVAPNPASSSAWDIDYIARAVVPTLWLDIYDATGARISHTADLETAVGEHHASIPIPTASGDYFLVLGTDREKTARKGSVAR